MTIVTERMLDSISTPNTDKLAAIAAANPELKNVPRSQWGATIESWRKAAELKAAGKAPPPQPKPGVRNAPTPRPAQADYGLTPYELERCKAKGYDPADWAASKARLFGNTEGR